MTKNNQNSKELIILADQPNFVNFFIQSRVSRGRGRLSKHLGRSSDASDALQRKKVKYFGEMEGRTDVAGSSRVPATDNDIYSS